jgi:hypothetical protein
MSIEDTRTENPRVGGPDSEKKLESGVTANFFYWGLEGPVWSGQYGAVLVLVNEWKLKQPTRK